MTFRSIIQIRFFCLRTIRNSPSALLTNYTVVIKVLSQSLSNPSYDQYLIILIILAYFSLSTIIDLIFLYNRFRKSKQKRMAQQKGLDWNEAHFLFRSMNSVLIHHQCLNQT